jgi:uncharacterized protein (TIGR02452 family)
MSTSICSIIFLSSILHTDLPQFFKESEPSEETQSLRSKSLIRRYTPEENIQIYLETCDASDRGSYCTQDGQTRNLDLLLQQSMVGDALIYPKIAPNAHAMPRFEEMEITVENRSTLSMAEQLIAEGYHPLVLDMANRYSAGGGVRHGANAQEETLCRESNLMKALLAIEEQGGYPLPELGGVYVPNVQFFRADPVDGYAFLDQPFIADVFVSAAYDANPDHPGDRPMDDRVYIENTLEKIRTMARAAILNQNDSLVLSAFGCGAFRNDPVLIASLYQKVLAEPEFRGQFRKIAFGILDDHRARNNFNTFQDILCLRGCLQSKVLSIFGFF